MMIKMYAVSRDRDGYKWNSDCCVVAVDDIQKGDEVEHVLRLIEVDGVWDFATINPEDGALDYYHMIKEASHITEEDEDDMTEEVDSDLLSMISDGVYVDIRYNWNSTPEWRAKREAEDKAERSARGKRAAETRKRRKEYFDTKMAQPEEPVAPVSPRVIEQIHAAVAAAPEQTTITITEQIANCFTFTEN